MLAAAAGAAPRARYAGAAAPRGRAARWRGALPRDTARCDRSAATRLRRRRVPTPSPIRHVRQREADSEASAACARAPTRNAAGAGFAASSPCSIEPASQARWRKTRRGRDTRRTARRNSTRRRRPWSCTVAGAASSPLLRLLLRLLPVLLLLLRDMRRALRLYIPDDNGIARARRAGTGSDSRETTRRL